MILVQCTECSWEGPPLGLGPHRGRRHPEVKPLQDYVRVRVRDLSENNLARLVDFIQDIDRRDRDDLRATDAALRERIEQLNKELQAATRELCALNEATDVRGD